MARTIGNSLAIQIFTGQDGQVYDEEKSQNGICSQSRVLCIFISIDTLELLLTPQDLWEALER